MRTEAAIRKKVHYGIIEMLAKQINDKELQDMATRRRRLHEAYMKRTGGPQNDRKEL